MEAAVWIAVAVFASQVVVGCGLSRGGTLRATLRDLAWLRIAIGVTGLYGFLWIDAAQVTGLPVGMQRPLGLFSVFKESLGLADAFRDPTFLAALKAAAFLSTAAFAAGLWTRATAVIGALVYACFLAVEREYNFCYHQFFIVPYLMTFAALGPCGRVWSVDAWMARRGGRAGEPADEPRADLGLARAAVWMPIVLMYFCAFVSKVRNGGWGWWDSANIRASLFGDQLDDFMRFDFGLQEIMFATPPVFYSAIGLTGLAVEGLFPLVLISPWARRLLPVVVAGLHVGVLFLQRLLFPDLILLPLFFWGPSDFRRWRDRAAGPAPRVRRGVIFYRVVIGLTVAVFMAGNLYRIEYYPLTSWKMYSARNRVWDAWYTEIRGVTASGDRVGLQPWRYFSIYEGSRHRPILYPTLTDEAYREPVAESFREIMRRVNAEPGRASDPLVRIEIEIKTWNFMIDRDGPGRGDGREHVKTMMRWTIGPDDHDYHVRTDR